MSIFDVAYGAHCDHVVREPITISAGAALLRWNVDSTFRRITLYRNGELVVLDTLVYSFNTLRPKWIGIAGLTLNPTVYPLDDYELEYAVVPAYCSKCNGGQS